jgi:hypothetical protein
MKNLYIIKELIWSKNKTMSDRNKQVKKKTNVLDENFATLSDSHNTDPIHIKYMA